MHRVILLLALLAVTACTPTPPPLQGYRRDVPITSIVAFDPVRFSGDWFEVAAFRPANAAACTAARARYILRPDGGLDLTESTFARPGEPHRRGVAVLTGPGRLTVSTATATETLWILWVDESYRTAVIGMPSGKIGLILNRDPVIPPDRLAAAREILDWNGYDLSRLQLVPQP